MRTNGCHFVKNHFKSGQKYTGLQWSGFHMVWTKAIARDKAQPFAIQPSKSPDFKCFRISNGWISDPHCNCNILLADWFARNNVYTIFITVPF